MNNPTEEMTARYEDAFGRKATTGTGYTYDFVKRICRKVRDLEFKVVKRTTEEAMRCNELLQILKKD